MKVCICCCAKKEEKYIKEWLDWHLSLGIDHIFIADNNDSEYEYQLEKILKNYIDEKKITLYNYKDKINQVQLPSYKQMYNDNKYKYDWLIFIDVDEFINIPETNNNIKLFLLQEKFKNADSISLGWLNYNDNDLIYYEDKPLQERFTKYIPINKNNKTKCKTIIRGNLNNVCPSIHFSPGVKNRYDVKGYTIDETKTIDINFDYTYLNICYIKHFMYKTIEEYIEKILKSNAYLSYTAITRFNIDNFFRYNKKTKEKEDIILKNQDKILKVKFEYTKNVLKKEYDITVNRLNLKYFDKNRLNEILNEITYIYKYL